MQTFRMMKIPVLLLALVASVSLAACQGGEEAAETDLALRTFHPAGPGTLAFEGAHSGTIVALETALEVRVDGSPHTLTVEFMGDEQIASWDGQVVDPDAELPAELETALDLAHQALDDEGLVEHLFMGELAPAETFEGKAGGGEVPCGCVTDDDCVKTVPGCCPCSAGGQEIAVSKECAGGGLVGGCDKPVACLQVYLCTDSEAVCEAGQCVLTEGGISF